MRILQLAPLWETVPPPAYGGTEAVVSVLCEELVRRGHDVTLWASGDSRTSAELYSIYHRSLRTASDLGDPSWYALMHAAYSLKDAGAYDIVHNHIGEIVMSRHAGHEVHLGPLRRLVQHDQPRGEAVDAGGGEQ
jgi:glycosyltransferase involved in cell wall biosynthesis